MRMGKAMCAGLVVVALIAGAAVTSVTAAQRSKMIQVKGSDTMVNLVQIMAEEFMAKNPNIPIAVLGGGSGTGVVGLINKTCDVANHSREIKKSEYEQMAAQNITPREFIIAVDGLSVIVNSKNPVKTLTMADVGAIYRGDIKNWKDVGGPDKAISLYGRQSNSGTYVFMQEFVLGNKNYSSEMKEMNGNAQIIEGVINDEAGIGYVGVGYLFDASGKVRSDLKIVDINKEKGAPAFSPLNKKAVDSGDYPIARPLYQSTAGKPSPDVAKFLQFVTGPEGQKIVEKEGFFTIGPGHKAQNDKNLK